MSWLNIYFINCHLINTAAKIELSSHTSSSDSHKLIGFKAYQYHRCRLYPYNTKVGLNVHFLYAQLINRVPVTINRSHCNIIFSAVIYTQVKAPVHDELGLSTTIKHIVRGI